MCAAHADELPDAIRAAVEGVTSEKASIGNQTPLDDEAYMEGQKEQQYSVTVHELGTGDRGQVIVDATKEDGQWKAEVVRKVGV